MNTDIIYSILYGIIYKITDEFYDEDVYKKWFPNGKIVIYYISILSTIFLFYFRSRDSPMYLLLYMANIFHIITLILKYYQHDYLIQYGPMDLSFDDPFVQLAIIQLPGLLINLNMCLTHIFKLLNLFWVALIIILLVEIVPQLVSEIVTGKKMDSENKKNKVIFRLAGVFSHIIFFKYYNEPYIQPQIFLSLGYFATSVISLIIQQIEEERIKTDNFFKRNRKITNKIK